MSGQVFVTSDLHLGHRRMVEYRGFSSVEEHDGTIIQNLCEAVGNKGNTLWVLGDVAFNRKSLAMLLDVPGTKKLVLGNHDMYGYAEYSKYFSKIYGVLEIKPGFIFSHIPVARQQSYRYKCNIHGHLHKEVMYDLSGKVDSFYRSVCLERHNLHPVLLEDLCYG